MFLQSLFLDAVTQFLLLVVKCDQLFLGLVHFVDLDVELLSDVRRCTLLLHHSISPGV